LELGVRNGVNIHIFAAPYKTKKAFKGSNLSLLAMSGMQEMHLQKLRPSSERDWCEAGWMYEYSGEQDLALHAG
jgi:hypothetical protein